MTTYINHGSTCFPNLNIKKIEEAKNATFVCELAIKGIGGWTENPAQIYYQETPPVAGHSNYFALIYQLNGLVITSGASVVGIPIEGIVTPAGEIIYSRYRHDFRKAKTADIFVDGGLDYRRLVGDIHNIEDVVLTIKGAQLVQVTDEEEIAALYKNKKALFGGQ